MKQVIFVFCVLLSLQNSFAQNQTNRNNKTVDSLKNLLSYTTEPVERFKILNAITDNIGLHVGNLDSSVCIEMLDIAQKLNNDSLLAISYNMIGEYVARIKGDNTSGLEYYFKAIPLAEKAKDKRQLSSIYFDMSLIFFNLQNIEEAVKYVRKGGANLPSTSHPLYNFMMAQYQRGMAIYFVLTNQPDSALAYVQSLGITSRKINSPLFQFGVYYLSGAAYDEQGDKDLAEVWFKKAVNSIDEVSSFYALQRFSLAYIPFLLRNHQYNNAKEQSRRVFDAGTRLNNNDLKLVGASFLQQVYDSLHNTDSAYYYSRMEVSLNAAIFNQNNINKIQALAFDEQIRNMEEEDAARDAEEQRQQNIQYALIALGIIIFITLFLLLSRTVVANEKLISFFAILGLLVVFEFINLLIHPWLAHFTHESPVLMLLALVIIASLLIPLHHRLEHWIKEKMIEKNKAIRLAVAKKTIEKLDKK